MKLRKVQSTTRSSKSCFKLRAKNSTVLKKNIVSRNDQTEIVTMSGFICLFFFFSHPFVSSSTQCLQTTPRPYQVTGAQSLRRPVSAGLVPQPPPWSWTEALGIRGTCLVLCLFVNFIKGNTDSLLLSKYALFQTLTFRRLKRPPPTEGLTEHFVVKKKKDIFFQPETQRCG